MFIEILFQEVITALARISLVMSRRYLCRRRAWRAVFGTLCARRGQLLRRLAVGHILEAAEGGVSCVFAAAMQSRMGGGAGGSDCVSGAAYESGVVFRRSGLGTGWR